MFSCCIRHVKGTSSSCSYQQFISIPKYVSCNSYSPIYTIQCILGTLWPVLCCCTVTKKNSTTKTDKETKIWFDGLVFRLKKAGDIGNGESEVKPEVNAVSTPVGKVSYKTRNQWHLEQPSKTTVMGCSDLGQYKNKQLLLVQVLLVRVLVTKPLLPITPSKRKN